MAIEAKRKCGYRKVGGLYIVSGGLSAPCCKLPIVLKTCPTCAGGIKHTRGWTWIDPRPWLKGECTNFPARLFGDTLSNLHCAAADPDKLGERVGLLWIGVEFYPTPESFAEEANAMGVSRRIVAIPRGFKLGEHFVFLAHPRVRQETDTETGESVWVGGIFRIFRPTRLEKIITETMAKDETEMAKLKAQHITPVIVPDDDKDHQGSVYDKEEALLV